MRWPRHVDGTPFGLYGAIAAATVLSLGLTKMYPGIGVPRYIAPSELKIEHRDLDSDGKPEIIMRIGNESYVLREKRGRPVLSRYEIK